MKKYFCTICGYVYNPILGNPDKDISPGTPFEKLPDNWTCPVCGTTRENFSRKD